MASVYMYLSLLKVHISHWGQKSPYTRVRALELDSKVDAGLLMNALAAQYHNQRRSRGESCQGDIDRHPRMAADGSAVTRRACRAISLSFLLFDMALSHRMVPCTSGTTSIWQSQGHTSKRKCPIEDPGRCWECSSRVGDPRNDCASINSPRKGWEMDDGVRDVGSARATLVPVRTSGAYILK